ncbi:ABC transporter permease [Ruminococcus sp.]|uniref:ABC transporter permease n=1 Tax=Ruminococcus sp. TaxID=41978 RepID=UPI0026013CE4|nr:ABC transporter permease [Ruminococcus sp.]MBQ8966970.1 ABC transporter permease [Ruminococcus sp.]
MLLKKMLRDIKENFAQFFSIFLLSAVAMWCYTGFQANVIGGKKARAEFEENTNFADGWIYGAQFDEDSVKKVEEIDKVKEVQLRTEVLGKADEKYNTAEIWCYFQDELKVTRPYNVGGADFDPDDEDGIWLLNRFADTWKLKVGDKFTVHVMGLDIEKEIKGFVNIPEREFMCASTDTDTDFHNIGYVYLSSKVLPEEMRVYNEMIFTCEGDPLKLDDAIDDALDGGYAFIGDRKSLDGYNRLTDELSQHDGFSYIFSFVFVAIALLVIVTTMKRMVAQQRTQIGTLNALGMKNRKIMLHYMSFSMVVSALGSIAGLALGVVTFGRIMVDMFGKFYPVPGWEPDYNYKSFVLAAAIVLICALAAYFSCRRILKIHPSEALRPATAKSSKPTIFEKLPFWNKLSFNARYNLRDIARSKMRAFMGIFGTCVGMMLMNLGLGAYDTLDYVKNWYFKDLQNYQYQVLFTDSCTPEQAEEVAEETGGELVGMDLISIAAKDHPVSDDIISAKLAVTEGKGLYCVSDRELELAPIKAGTVALTMKQADRLGLTAGDDVYWKTQSENEWHCSEIGMVSRHPSITGITMLREDYEDMGLDFRANMLVAKSGCDGLDSREYISAVHDIDDLEKAFDKNMEVMDILVWFMVFFSAMLIIIVLYNSGNLSFNEREKEFATLKVMGFKSSAIRRLISTQNLWLSIIGVLLGLPLGQIPLQAMMDSNGDSVDWPCYIAPLTYVEAGIFVMLVSVLVGFMFARRIKRIDMVEVLKGLE